MTRFVSVAILTMAAALACPAMAATPSGADASPAAPKELVDAWVLRDPQERKLCDLTLGDAPVMWGWEIITSIDCAERYPPSENFYVWRLEEGSRITFYGLNGEALMSFAPSPEGGYVTSPQAAERLWLTRNGKVRPARK